MGLNIAGNIITGYDGSYNLTINNGSVDCLKIDTSDRSVMPANPAFIAGISTGSPGWVDFTASTWNIIPCNTTSINVGSCYNTSSPYLFTAPIAGTYHFIGSLYLTNNSDTTAFIYPVFLVNGSLATRHPNSNNVYRIRGYQETTADGQISETYVLSANDTVGYYCYAFNTNCKYYNAYSYFAGVFIG
jgi:hypothetical protein